MRLAPAGVHVKIRWSQIRWSHLFLASWAVVGSSAVVGSTSVSTAPGVASPPTGRAPVTSAARAQTATVTPQANPMAPSKAFVETYCVTCHNELRKTAGLALDTLANVAAHAPEWEKAVVK